MIDQVEEEYIDSLIDYKSSTSYEETKLCENAKTEFEKIATQIEMQYRHG